MIVALGSPIFVDFYESVALFSLDDFGFTFVTLGSVVRRYLYLVSRWFSRRALGWGTLGWGTLGRGTLGWGTLGWSSCNISSHAFGFWLILVASK